MASSTSRVFSRVSSMALKLNNKKSSMPTSIFGDSFLNSTLQSSAKRSCLLSRLPVELSGVQTMLPLHSAIASARLKSSLSIESQTWGIVPQGSLVSHYLYDSQLSFFIPEAVFMFNSNVGHNSVF